MVAINQIYRNEAGRLFQITGCISNGEWASTSIPEADPMQRYHTVLTQELTPALTPRMRTHRGIVKPFPQIQNDRLMGEIRNGTATLIR